MDGWIVGTIFHYKLERSFVPTVVISVTLTNLPWIISKKKALIETLMPEGFV
jgi:hypothetical protein